MTSAAPTDPAIYHITHGGNLPSILAHGCLWSDVQRVRRGIVSTNIGYSHIKRRRLKRQVPVAAGGMLSDYVPFYFCNRSVMLYVISKGASDYSGSQDKIVHLVSSVGRATATGRPWAFTDRHAELRYAEFFSDLADLHRVDWSVMPRTHWVDCREQRQAEFLVHDHFLWAAVDSIGVRTAAIAARVEEFLVGATHRPRVHVAPSWYY